MQGTPVWTICVFVFLSVIVPYFIADLAMKLPSSESNAIGRALPGVYRFFYPVVAWAAEAFGQDVARMRPERTETIRRQLLLAAMPVTPQFIYGAQIVFAGIGLASSILFFLMGATPLMATGVGCIFAMCGWFMPAFALDSAAENRQTAIIKDLPFAIDLIGTAMQAGLDFNAAVRYYVGLDYKNALTVEFGQMLREAELGMSRVDALLAMAKRIQSPPFTSFVDAIAHGSEIGASLVGTMRDQGEDMRRARFNIAERKAVRAPSIMIFPMALFIMPAVFLVVGFPVWLRFKSTGL